MKLLYILLSASICYSKTLPAPKLGEDIVNHINNMETTWTAANDNQFSWIDKDQIKSHLGLLDSKDSTIPLKVFKHKNEDIPKSFDAREKWSKCSSIGLIRDQANCGSCWAVATTSVFSDRICVHSNQEKDILISAENLFTCTAIGCMGGTSLDAWEYLKKNGTVTGGPYGDNTTCAPYPYKSCSHTYEIPGLPACQSLPDHFFDQPPCTSSCVNGADFNKDKHFIDNVYRIKASDVQQEIIENGPVTAAFRVYMDFVYYKSGIYQHLTGDLVAGHLVKVIGWGEEDGTPYWLVANSWNDKWGENGLFRIKRGSNECEFESEFYGGIPRD